MDSLLAQTKTLVDSIGTPLFDPNFLNVQYFFNLVFVFLNWILSLLLRILGNDAIISKETLQHIFIAFCILLVVAIIYIYRQLRTIQKKEDEHLGGLQISAFETTGERERNYKWKEIIDHLDSFNEADWRVAIIKADTILEDIIDKMGYHGDTLGEKLKMIEESDFVSLSQAWEAHKVRNKIAHEGDFALSKREARRVIDLYRQVFEEFHYIEK